MFKEQVGLDSCLCFKAAKICVSQTCMCVCVSVCDLQPLVLYLYHPENQPLPEKSELIIFAILLSTNSFSLWFFGSFIFCVLLLCQTRKNHTEGCWFCFSVDDLLENCVPPGLVEICNLKHFLMASIIILLSSLYLITHIVWDLKEVQFLMFYSTMGKLLLTKIICTLQNSK